MNGTESTALKSKLNILFLSHERKLGGANLCLLELATEMKKRGHRVVVTVLFRNCPLDRALKEAGIDTFPCFYGWWQMPKNWNLLIKTAFRLTHLLDIPAGIRLRHLIKKNDINVIYSNTSCIDIGMKTARKTGLPHIWHFREFGEADYGLMYMNGRERSLSKVNDTASKVVFISEALRKSYPEIKDELAQVVYDGVSTANASESKLHHKDRKTFLVSGNLSKGKNQMLVLRAFSLLEEKYKDKYRLLLAGSATSRAESKEYETELKAFADRHLMSNVEFLGFVSDMKTLRTEVDVEIVPSISEAFGRVTVEAMMSRNPVLVSDSGASPELIENGKSGLIFENDNEEALKKLISDILDDKYDLDAMGEAGYRLSTDSKSGYTLEINVDRMEEIFKAQVR